MNAVVDAIAGATAVLASTLFAGAALYVSLAEHPARMECATEVATAEFGPSYRRAAVMQVALVLVATVAAVTRWLGGGGALWLSGGLCLLAAIPYTLLVIMPTNKRLLDPDLDRRAPETRALLLTWGRLHAVRTALGLISALLLIGALGRS